MSNRGVYRIWAVTCNSRYGASIVVSETKQRAISIALRFGSGQVRHSHYAIDITDRVEVTDELVEGIINLDIIIEHSGYGIDVSRLDIWADVKYIFSYSSLEEQVIHLNEKESDDELIDGVEKILHRYKTNSERIGCMSEWILDLMDRFVCDGSVERILENKWFMKALADNSYSTMSLRNWVEQYNKEIERVI